MKEATITLKRDHLTYPFSATIVAETREGYLLLFKGYLVFFNYGEASVSNVKTTPGQYLDNEIKMPTIEGMENIYLGGTLMSSLHVNDILEGGIKARQGDTELKFSESLEESDYRNLMGDVLDALSRPGRGILVFHGTDTLTLTASLLFYAFPKLDRSIFFLSTQRGLDCPYNELLEYLNAINSCAEKLKPSVYIVSSRDKDINQIGFFCPINSMKSHSSNLNTFIPVVETPLAMEYSIHQGIRVKNPGILCTAKENITASHLENAFPVVHIEYPLTITTRAPHQDKPDFTIVVGTGLGNLPTKYIQSREVDATSVIVTNCPFGPINEKVYSKATAGTYGFLRTVEANLAKLIIGYLITSNRRRTIEYLLTDVGDELVER